MGLFDTIYCEYPLPEPADQALRFQTKEFECLFDTYLITAEGRLIRKARGLGQGLTRDVEWPFHGDLRIYTSEPDGATETRRWVEYRVRFTHGRVEWIRPFDEVEGVVHWYHEGRVSGSKAAQIAGMTRLEFLDELARRKLDVIKVDLDQLREEIEPFAS